MPRVFVSYSCDSPEHIKWVADFATRLREAEIDARFDEWEVQFGDHLPQFMEQEIAEADHVLIVCTPAYKAKSDARKGGVGYEGNIISGELFSTGNQRKFITVLRAGDEEASIPTGLRGKKYCDLRSGDEQVLLRLIDTLLGRPGGPPPLGSATRTPSDRPVGHDQVSDNPAGQSPVGGDLETQILSLLVGAAASSGRKYIQLAPVLGNHGFDLAEVNDALELLGEDGLLELDDMIGGDPYLWDSVTVPVKAFLRVPKAVGFDLEDTASRLARFVVDHGPTAGPQASEGLQEPPERLNWAAAYLERQGLAEVERCAGTHPFDFSTIEPTARTRKVFSGQREKLQALASNPVPAVSGLVAPRIQDILKRGSERCWLSVFLAPIDNAPVSIDVDAQATVEALNAIRLPEEADGPNGSHINVTRTRPYKLGLINEDLRNIESGSGHFSEVRQDGLIEIAVCLESLIERVSEALGSKYGLTPPVRIMRYPALAQCTLSLAREVGALASRLAVPAPVVLGVVLTGTADARLFSHLDFVDPVLGHPVSDGFLEIQRPIHDFSALNSEIEAAIKYFVRCFGMRLPALRDDKGQLARPGHIRIQNT